MRTFWPIAKSEAPAWTSKWALISAPYQRGMRCGTKKTNISLGVVEICVESSMRDILRERYLIICGTRDVFLLERVNQKIQHRGHREKRRTQRKTRLPQRRGGRRENLEQGLPGLCRKTR